MKMSAIRERRVLSLTNLPRKLTSRRNLRAHFSKFGDVEDVSVNKELMTGKVHFSSHFNAQSAKIQGAEYDGEPLTIYWSEAGSSLDPRARVKQDFEATDDGLWQDDDKECFGVESVQPIRRDESKQSAKDLIKMHLKLPGAQRRLVSITEKDGNKTKIPVIVSQQYYSPGVKMRTKTLLSPKKSNFIMGKPKFTRKELEQNVKSKKKTPSNQELVSKSYAPVMEVTDLKQKLALLDERDKMIRKTTVQGSDIKTAVAMKGTCPDMCPERERVLRQCRFAVALYEMCPGTNEMDENKAVKEYSRSSADQEVPLPHDLRPEPVLSMTMNYLITNIITRIDNPDENKAVWYSFCWNRLRSVRKDIILQQLCDMETVKIVEQCARFHISCYDHMWGAEVSGFDDKINTQNLIDCLQTLRHMYEDLGKHNVICPNEAEFYSYLILLKLTSGDVMWEYQQYSLGIQLSPQVQFAIQAYMAFKNNMYSTYFSLVKKASYLTACLMQRYFDEVRTQALKIMFKAYCRPGKTVGLSSSFIVSSLKFDSHKSALRFCEKEELDVKIDCEEKEEDTLDSISSFLIREKRLLIANAVVGQNEPLPCYNPHQVHSSFDESGNLIQALPAALDEEEEGIADLTEEPLNSKNDESNVDIPDFGIQKSSFKFSLSPTIAHSSNIFGETIFSNQIKSDNTDQNKGSMSEFAEFTMTEEDPAPKDDHFAGDNVDFYEMEQADYDVESSFEDIDMKENLSIGNVSEFFNPFQKSPFIFQQSSVTAPVPTIASSFTFIKKSDTVAARNLNFTDSKQDIKIVDIVNDKENIKEKSAFHFVLPTNDTFNFYPEKCSNPLNELSPTKLNKNKFEFKFDMFKPDQHQENRKVETTINYEKINQLDYKKSTSCVTFRKTSTEEREERDQIAQAIEIEKKALLLEKLLREKAEEEKLKLEEAKKLEEEREKQLKKIEEQKVLKSLKKDLSKRMKAINARKYARQWKEKVQKLKISRADFPMLVQLPVESHLSLWGSINYVPTDSIFQRAKDKINVTKVTSQLLLSGITECCRYISFELAEKLARSACKTMKKGVLKPIFWKLTVCVPWENRSSSELSTFNHLMRRWCNQSFYKTEYASVGCVEHLSTSLQIPVNISIHFCDDLSSTEDVKASDAMVFVVLNDSESEKMCLQRLRTLVTCQVKNSEFSVAVMNIGGNKLDRVLKIELEELHEQNLVAHWTVKNWLSPSSIMDGLSFLTEHIDVVPHICTTLLDILVKEVSEDFFDMLHSSQHYCIGLRRAMKSPTNVIYLYNTFLTKFEDLLMSSKLEKYFNFAEEFRAYVSLNESGGPELLCGKQYNNNYKSRVSKKIHSLKLPDLSDWPPRSPNHLVKIVETYCNCVHDGSVFSQIMRKIDLQDDEDLQLQLGEVSWLDIVETWSECQIRHTFSVKETSKRMVVIFNKNDIERVIKRPWWIKLPIVAQLDI